MQIPADMQRTSCACKNCIAGCKTKPGCLAPGDLERIQEFVGDTSPEFVLSHFLSSEGAKCLKKINGTVYIFHVPSIVPAQKPDGSCIFLDEQERCTIHPVSPFGCAYHDTHMQAVEADRRMQFCVTEQIKAHYSGEPYAQMQQFLDDNGRRAVPLNQRAEAMRKVIDKNDKEAQTDHQ